MSSEAEIVSSLGKLHCMHVKSWFRVPCFSRYDSALGHTMSFSVFVWWVSGGSREQDLGESGYCGIAVGHHKYGCMV